MVNLLILGIGGDNDSAAIAGAFSAVVAFPESRDVANAFVTTLQSAVRACALTLNVPLLLFASISSMYLEM